MIPVKDFDGYFIDSELNIVSKKRNGIVKILRPALSGCGYLNVVLMKNNKRYAKKIHRILAETLIPLVENKTHVNHKNGIKTDNRIENLEWVDRSENVRHAIANGLIKTNMGYTGRLDDIQLITLFTIPKTTGNGINTTFTNRSISKEWKISESTISNIRNGNFYLGHLEILKTIKESSLE